MGEMIDFNFVYERSNYVDSCEEVYDIDCENDCGAHCILLPLVLVVSVLILQTLFLK